MRAQENHFKFLNSEKEIKNVEEKESIKREYLERELKMQTDNAKMWEDKWKNDPKVIHNHTSSGGGRKCNIF